MGFLSNLWSLVTGQQEIIFSPSGCALEAHDAHESHTQPLDTFTLIQELNAPTGRVRMLIQKSVIEKRSRLIWSWDILHGSAALIVKQNTRWGKAVATYGCEGGTFRTKGDGEIVDVDYRTYTARAVGRVVHDPCSN